MPQRLKSLELQGYKTFASRTIFEFAGNVTAIVGPNGSGKSNIADSLRWVLGEQSYGLLRGKKTEDMIFSGSQQRPRASMASATVIFDNSDGWLPIEFAEVSIARRAYRDGQNEYLINGQRVRLRDVNELLAQSGLAERTYTIIGQGVVDAALALKAEERRRLFEEAAGIGLHRSRREEALRRLDTTHRNLDRVRDILAELKPRLRSLERQARRAQEYEQVRADLKVLLREWYGYHWHRAQKELGEARSVARRLEAALEEARKKQDDFDQHLQRTRGRIYSLREQLNVWRRQLAGLHARREELVRKQAVEEERERSLAAQKLELEGQINRLEEEMILHQERLQRAAHELAARRVERSEAGTQAERARAALETRQAERREVEEQLEAYQQKLGRLNAQKSEFQARLVERQAQMERQQRTLELAAEAKARLEGELQEVEAAVAAASAEVKLCQGKLDEVEAQRKDNENSIRAQEALRREVKETANARAQELSQLRAQLQVLEQAEAALVGYTAGTQVLLKAARGKRLAARLGALSNQLEVEPEYETAIAAALGDFIDAVLLDESSSTDEALELLRNEAARGALLPLGNIKVTRPGRASQSATRALGWAVDFVQAAPELSKVVETLLGDTLIVRDRQAARDILAKLDPQAKGAGTDVRVVTLQGEVFLSSGAVLLRSLEREAGSQTILSRPRQVRELTDRIKQAQSNLTTAEAQLAEVDARLVALRAEEERLVASSREARQALQEAEATYREAVSRASQAKGQLRFQREQHDTLQEVLVKGRVEVRQMETRIRQLGEEIAVVEGEARERARALAAIPLDELQNQLTHWETLQQVATRALEEADGRRQQLEEIAARTAHTLQAAQSRLQELDGLAEKLESGREDNRLAYAELNTEIDALRARVEPAENELQEQEKEQDSLREAEAKARQVLSKAEHRLAQAKINVVRRQEALENWRRRIEDDFGLVEFEYAADISGPNPLPLDGMVEQLPRVTGLAPEIEENVKRQRAQLRRMGAINPEAQAEYQEVKQRYEFLTAQVADLEQAEADVRRVIAELDAIMQHELRQTFEAVAREFSQIFQRLFGGGSARLSLTDPDDMTNTGIDIEARLPGRRPQGLSLLSGGERSLTATSLIFALLRVSPTPFCVLDEVDAMLDEANVGRFRELLRELSANTQFVIVTHNRNTVQVADVIYGVTMGRDSASQVISLKLDEVADIID